MVHTTNPPPEQWPTTARVHGPVIVIVTETLARLSTHWGGVATDRQEAEVREDQQEDVHSGGGAVQRIPQ